MRYKVILPIVSVVIIIIVAVLVAARWWLPAPSNPAQTPDPSTVAAASQPIVRYDGSAFSPAQYTVKSGSKIVFLNITTAPVTISSQGTANSELDVGVVPAGSSKTVTLTKVGTWSYHALETPSVSAILTVQ